MWGSRFLGAIRARRSYVAGLAVLVAAALVLPWGWDGSTRAVVAWDLGVAVFAAMALSGMRGKGDPDSLRQRAEALDEGRVATLLLSILGAVAAMAAVVIEMGLAGHERGAAKALRVVLTIATIALSWFFVHLVFALHYAHEYYSAAKGRGGRAPRRGGLKFPGGDETPDYWDFLHFSVVIGVAAQTADVAIETKTVRRLVTLHGVIAFVFNTVILALAINLSAGLL